MLNISNFIKKILIFSLKKNRFFIKKYNLVIIKTKLKIYGDYQINGLINFTKKYNINIINLFKIVSNIFNKKKYIFKKIILTKNFFINIFINNKWLYKFVNNLFLKLKKKTLYKKKKTIIIDYSSPNIAKELHIGHLRSTVIGDVIGNIYNYLGYKIIRINHIGDWGKQFGLIISYLKIKNIINSKNLNTIPYNKLNLKNISLYYVLSQYKYNHSLKYIKLVNYYTFLLQNNTIFNNIWKKIIKLSIKKNQIIYKKLNISLNINNIYGESFYKPLLKDIINDLLIKNIIYKNKNSLISKVFIKKIKKINTLIIKKSNGSYLYSTTDIAAIKYRYLKFKPTKILYFIDSRQQTHMEHVIYITKKANYIPKNFLIKHLIIGIILDKNNKPFKTREGNYFTLNYFIKKITNISNKLLYKKLIKKKYLKYQIKNIINNIAISSIKYFELSKKRNLNYIFNIEKAISFKGNTALYILYAYIRIISIIKKIKIKKSFYKDIILTKNYFNNRSIIIKIIQFEEILEQILKSFYPHLLCNYLYNLSKLFSIFYEKNNIILEKNKIKQQFYIKIIFIIYYILKISLKLLGITIINKI